VLRGRAQEQVVMDDFLTLLRAPRSDARPGPPLAVVLRGEHGIGASAMLADTVDRAHGITVLQTAGDPATGQPPFAGVVDLLGPVLDRVPELSAAQTAALAGALSLAPAGRGDRLGVFEGARELVGRLADETPVLLVVDDLQWLDPDSRDCVLHVVRRSRAARIGLLASAGPTPTDDLLDLPAVDLGPLDDRAALEVLRAVTCSLSQGVERALLAAARGNALALTELPTMLRQSELTGAEELPTHLPIGPRLRAGFAGRLARLPDDARTVLLLLALGRNAGNDHLARILRRLGTDHGVLDPALDDGLVVLRNGRVDFAHPMVRLAVIDAAPPGRTRWANEQLAAVLPGHEAAWHLASAVLGPDEEVATSLESAADQALARHSPALAADTYARAAALSEDGDRATARLRAAAAAAFAAGDATRALHVLEEAGGHATGATRWAVEHLAGVIEAWSIDARVGCERLRRAAGLAEGEAPGMAALMLADAASAASSWDCRLALGLAESAWDLAQGHVAGIRAVVGLSRCWCLILQGRVGEAHDLAAEIEPLLGAIDRDSPSALWVPWGLNLRVQMEDYEGAVVLARVVAGAVEDAGFAAGRALPVIVAADAGRRLGRLAGQAELIEDAVRVARDTGQRATEMLGECARAHLLATTGDHAGCREAARRAVDVGRELGAESARIHAGSALGLLALGERRWDEAAGVLEEVGRVAEAIGYRDPLMSPWLPDLVETYVRLDRREEAELALGRLADLGAGSDSPGAGAGLARCRGLLSGEDDDFEEALELHERARMPFATARTRLAWGELLRRRRRTSHARHQLALAREGFLSIGATAWADHARVELEACDPSQVPSRLTAQQRRIAEAVARGARNKEIAAELFLSEKTVERHLSRLFRLAGVRSRTELARWVSDQGGARESTGAAADSRDVVGQ
jgi:DNA-binding CsgD family transcriptional regulator